MRTLRVREGPGVCRMGKEDFQEMVWLGKWASAESKEGSGQWQERGLGMKSRVAHRIDELRHSLLNQSPGEGSCSLLPHLPPL